MKDNGNISIRDKRRRQKRNKRVLIALVVLAAIIAIAALLLFKVFVIKNVKVSGNNLYSSKQIEQTVLDDKYSWSTLYVYFKYKFTEHEKMPFIDTLEIKMNSPTSISIDVYEKGLLGYIVLDNTNKYAFFDKDGIVSGLSSKKIEDVPLIEGLDIDKVVLYETLPVKSEILKSLLDITQTLKKYELIPGKIKRKSDGTYILKYGKIKVAFGTDINVIEKVVRLSEIMPQLDGLKGTLHMEEWSQDTTDITFEKDKE